MGFIGTIRSVGHTIEDKVAAVTDHVHHVIMNPVLSKTSMIAQKSMLIITKSLALASLSASHVSNDLKGTIGVIGFYSTAKNFMFWINPFSKKTMNEKIFLKSLNSSILKENKFTSTDVPKTIFNEVMAKPKYRTKRAVLKELKISLNKHGYEEKQIQSIAKRVIIRKKSRPITQVLSMMCFTVVDLGSNIKILHRWGILNLSKIAITIGRQSPVFSFVLKVSLDTFLSTVASAGLILVVGEASYRAIINALKGLKHHREGNTEEKAKALKEFRNAMLDIFAVGSELIVVSLPLLFVINPPVVLALAITAKAIGIGVIVVKQF